MFFLMHFRALSAFNRETQTLSVISDPVYARIMDLKSIDALLPCKHPTIE